MTLAPSQIEVLARFDGWVRDDFELLDIDLGTWVKGCEAKADQQMVDHLTSPGMLIEMRLKVNEKYSINPSWDYTELGELILNKKYTAAAIKTVEIIEKIEA
jgi:hypothetical protein